MKPIKVLTSVGKRNIQMVAEMNMMVKLPHCLSTRKNTIMKTLEKALKKYFKAASTLIAVSFFLSSPVMAEEKPDEPTFEFPGMINTISEEGKAYMETDEYRNLIQSKLDHLASVSSPNTAILENHLDVPWYTQENNYYCSPCCAQIVLAYISGTTYSQDYLAGLMGTQPVIGTYVDDLAAVVDQLSPEGYHWSFSSNLEQNFYPIAVANIDTNCPVIYNVDPSQFNIGYNSCGHSIVGCGYQGDLVSWYDPFPGFNDVWMCDTVEMNMALNSHEGGYYVW